MAGREIVIGEKSRCIVPQIARDELLAFFGALVPFRGVSFVPQPAADLLHILLSFVEQAVQTDRRVVLRGIAKWPKTKGDIESRFPHGAVAFVILRTQLKLFALIAVGTSHGVRNAADLETECGPRNRVLLIPRLALNNVAIGL